jgi:hypothetical protein
MNVRTSEIRKIGQNAFEELWVSHSISECAFQSFLKTSRIRILFSRFRFNCRVNMTMNLIGERQWIRNTKELTRRRRAASRSRKLRTDVKHVTWPTSEPDISSGCDRYCVVCAHIRPRVGNLCVQRDLRCADVGSHSMLKIECSKLDVTSPSDDDACSGQVVPLLNY